MRAIVINRHGDADVLEHRTDVPNPDVQPGEALVQLGATSLNRIDLFVREGYPGMSVDFPHIPGADVAGTVVDVAPDVSDFAEGDRVVAWPLVACGDCVLCRKGRRALCVNWQYIGLHRHGSYADYVRVPTASLIRLPDRVSVETAATLPVAGLTAYHALAGVGQLGSGETALIWGGSGGLGTFSIQLARHLGAHVIATVGDDAKRAQLEKLGPDLILDHHADDVEAAVRDFTDGAGVELVLDAVGAETFPTGFGLLQKGGRLLLCGKMTGMDVELSLHQTYLRHLSILGLYLGEKPEMEALLRLVAEGTVEPVADRTYPLDQAADAQRALQAGDRFGKLLLVP